MNQAQTVTGIRVRVMPSVRKSTVVVTKLIALRSAASEKIEALMSHDIDAGVQGKKKRCGHANQRGKGHPKGKPIERGKSHLSRANLQREQVVAKAHLRGSRQNKKNHQRAVQQSHRREALRGCAKTTQERNCGGRPGSVNAQQGGENHAHENTGEG